MKEVETFCPASPQEWREWLQTHHAHKDSIWLVCYKKKTGVPTVTWSEAVDQALCFGWIDSQRKPVNDEVFMQLFTRRKANSGWSRINKDKIERLMQQELMHEAGCKAIETARQNGSWTLLDEVEEGLIPADLAEAFEQFPQAQSYFLTLSKTDKRAILLWLVMAKRTETRQNRLAELLEPMSQGRKPKPCQ